jgi:hypothetical protein
MWRMSGTEPMPHPGFLRKAFSLAELLILSSSFNPLDKDALP